MFLTTLLVISVLAQPAAADGFLDSTWSDDGRLVIDRHAHEEIREVFPLPNGQIAAVGTPHHLVTRVGGTGTVDTTYGTGGFSEFDRLDGRSPGTRAAAMQDDGKILTALTDIPGPAVARWNRDGSPDPTFGTDGRSSGTAGQVTFTNDVITLGDGSIAAVASADGPVRVQSWLARFHPSGELDASFGSGGQQSVEGEVFSLAPSTGGGVVGAGYVETSLGDLSALFRFNATGLASVQTGPPGRASAVAVLPSGGTLTAGSSGADVHIARFTPSGGLDPSFGSFGVATVSFAGGVKHVSAVAAQGDGAVVFAGSTCSVRCDAPNRPDPWLDDEESFVGRLTPSGALDSTFAAGGIAAGVYGAPGERINALRILPAGQILVAGAACPAACSATTGVDLAFARLTGSGGGPAIPPLVPADEVRCTIVGTMGADQILGTRDDDVVCSLSGNDVVDSKIGNDIVFGGYGVDLVLGMGGDDDLRGGPDADALYGGNGADRLSGDAGGDLLVAIDAVNANDSLDGGDGADTCKSDKGDVRTSCEPPTTIA
jgi:uncharacterized delta-60 repeat protein